ncbi:hypothetical protein DA799_11740 [Lactiplantibacillus plantarum]|nr:hypothetical protein DA799_11740 [Lactiplantibacillus plantarum]
MIMLIKQLLENGPVVIHFTNGESFEISSLEVKGLPNNHTYHAVTADGTMLFFESSESINFVSSK